MNITTSSQLFTQYCRGSQSSMKKHKTTGNDQHHRKTPDSTPLESNCEYGVYPLFQNLVFTDDNIKLRQSQIRFHVASDEVINHDIELKQYLSGEKIFKQRNYCLQNFTKNEEIVKNEDERKPKHKKQKSKSQMSGSRNSRENQKLFSNLNLPIFESKHPYLKQNFKTEVYPYDQAKKSAKSSKQQKPIKFLDLNRQKLKQIQLKSLEIQLVIKRVNEKRQLSIKQIMKKLNLPKLNPTVESSLKRLIDSNQRNKHNCIFSEHNGIKTSDLKSKNTVTTNLTASISKLQESKIKELRKLEKTILMNKIKPNKTKEEQKTERSSEYIKHICNTQKYKSLYR